MSLKPGVKGRCSDRLWEWWLWWGDRKHYSLSI